MGRHRFKSVCKCCVMLSRAHLHNMPIRLSVPATCCVQHLIMQHVIIRHAHITHAFACAAGESAKVQARAEAGGRFDAKEVKVTKEAKVEQLGGKVRAGGEYAPCKCASRLDLL